jgi:hypothetical protein
MGTHSKKLIPIIVQTALVFAILTLASTYASAGPINQYASTVLGFSSEYPTYSGYRSTAWGAVQALGLPNVPVAGENYRAWAPGPIDGTLEYISLGFQIPVFASGVTVRETMGAGFVYQVDVLDVVGVWHTVWFGTDPSPRFSGYEWWHGQGQVAEFLVSFDTTPYLVTGVRIRTNTSTAPGVWEEIDSVQLHGTVPEEHSLILLALGVLSVAGYKLRQRS